MSEALTAAESIAKILSLIAIPIVVACPASALVRQN